MAKFKFVEWLVHWLEETKLFDFEWDTGNTRKSEQKHGIPPEEAEQVFMLGQAAPLGVQFQPEVDEERLGIVGPSYSGRLLHVVFTIRSGKIRPISSRLANRREKKYYEAYIREVS